MGRIGGVFNECELGPDLAHWAEQPPAMNDPKRQMTQPTAGRLEIHEDLVVHAEPIDREQTDAHFRKILGPRLAHVHDSAAVGLSAQLDRHVELIARRRALVQEARIAHAQLLDQPLEPNCVIVLDCQRTLCHVDIPAVFPVRDPSAAGASSHSIRFVVALSSVGLTDFGRFESVARGGSRWGAAREDVTVVRVGCARD